MVKRLDKYLLKELLFPFLIAVLGFIIFTLLFLIGQFSQSLIEGVLPTDQMILLLIYKVPYLAVYGLPFATLFAIFLALGRLGHDREIIAMQAGGTSLRRIVVPFIIFGLIVSVIALVVSDRVVPIGNQQFNVQMYELFFNSQRGPEISPDTFFRAGDEEIYIYGKSSELGEDVLENVLIFENSSLAQYNGAPSPYPRIITAERAEWSGQTWQLSNAQIYQLTSLMGLTLSSADEFTYNIDREFIQLSSRGKTDSEMTIAELAEKAERIGKGGLSTDSILVDLHLRVAIPAMCLIFALFGAPLALLIGTRGRAIGVILAVLLILLYQGILFWTAQIMGARGDINPVLGAWLPNILFGAIGIVLYWMSNRFGSLDLKTSFKNMLAIGVLVSLALTAWGTSDVNAQEQEAPIPVEADLLVINPDTTTWHFVGHVSASYQSGKIDADELELKQVSEELWEINALQANFAADDISGSAERITAQFRREESTFIPTNITLSQSASVEFSGGTVLAQRLSLDHPEKGTWDLVAEDRVRMEFEEQNHRLRAHRLTLGLQGELETPEELKALGANADVISGETDFTNAQGRSHRVRYDAETAVLAFNAENKLEQLDLDGVQFTTCTCTALIESADYSIQAGHMLIRPDQVLAAFAITFRLFGQPVFWAPAYVAPLGDLEQKYPFLPEVGHDSGRGWFAKWRLPFYVDESTFGNVILEYYSRFSEIGTGLDLRYRAFESSSGGTFTFYRLVGRGDSISVDWNDTVQLNETTQLGLFAGFRSGLLSQTSGNLRTGLNLAGREEEWAWGVAIFREQNLVDPEADEDTQGVRYLLLERFPELSISRGAIFLDENIPLNFSTSLNWGRYREESVSGEINESTRLDGGIQGTTDRLELFEGGDLQATGGFRLSDYEGTRRESLEFSTSLNFQPIQTMSVTIDYSWRQLRGRSPFEFDQIDTANRLRAQSNMRLFENANLSLSSGYNWIRAQYDPLALRFDFQPRPFQFQLGGEHDLNEGEFQGISFNSGYRGEGWTASLNTGYSFRSERFNDLIARVDLGEMFRIGARFDLNQRALERVSAQSQLEYDRWQLTVGAEIDVPRLRLATSQFSIVRNFCENCWQLAITGNHRQVSFQARITAFPTAGLTYSPTDQSLSFGR